MTKYSVKMSTYFGGMPLWLVFSTYRDVSTLLFFLWRVWVGVTRCSVPLATCNEAGFPSLLAGEWVGWDSVQNFPALLLTTALITSGICLSFPSPTFIWTVSFLCPTCLCPAQFGSQRDRFSPCRSLPPSWQPLRCCAAGLVFNFYSTPCL